MSEVGSIALQFGLFKPEIAPGEPCPCGSGDRYDACHGVDGQSGVRIVFYLDPDVDHRVLLALPDDMPMPLDQMEGDIVEAHFHPWEDVYGLGPAEDLLSPAGHERLGALIAEQSVSPDNYFSVEVGPALLIGVPFDVVRAVAIDRCRSASASSP